MNLRPLHGALAALFLELVAGPARAATDQPRRRQTATVTILVDQVDLTMDRLIDAAKDGGGYFLERDSDHLVLRIAAAHFDAYVALIKSLGVLVERRVENSETTLARATLAAKVTSDEAMLNRYFTAMAGSHSRSDLRTIQASTDELITAVEHGKGELKVMDHDAQFALIDISFKLRNRSPLKITHDNLFPWVETVGLDSLLADFDNPTEEN